MSRTRVPYLTRMSIWLRLFAVQGSWNYEILIGNGIGFCVEPALRLLPGGRGGERYRGALARQSRYFNAHPYLASVAVGALARAELDGVDPARIERFRIALAGPLGSVGDRLVWSGWLPLCSLLALGAYGVGGSAGLVVALFLIAFNAGHLVLRAWGLRAGFARGTEVAKSLASPLLRRAPEWIDRAGALLAGIAIPTAVERAVGIGGQASAAAIGAVLVGGVVLARIPNNSIGWRLALGVLSLIVLYAVIV
ncbi:MAG: PTS system mannose/fructose/sorbose family transporter subunit IID [Gemmatimonadota bacterium]|nr:PTS system mannose/fructose/sorbose family transporter subunit IID [Gemmatimonadaceae bacterium]MDQ3515683.1 PTS system mannose/fructose/sorbose family transporter subunit IID [Gemmatimonadota bacterium]